MRTHREIAICGSGPAGLAAASLLHRLGHRVCAFERFETPRPVGSGLILQPTGLSVLGHLGLREDIARLGARIERLFGRAVPSNRVVLYVRYAALGINAHAIAVHRAALFDLLHGAATRAGVQIRSGVSVAAVERSGRRAVLVASDGLRLGDFDLVVDALGANSPLAAGIAQRTVLDYGALWANVPWPEGGPMPPDALEQRYRRASAMAGVLPIGQLSPGEPRLAAFFWSLKRNQVATWRARGMGAWKAEVARLWPAALPVIDTLVEPEQLTFAQYDHFTARRPYSDRLVHIGDAARATSPQLGQGANMALLDALALSQALELHDDLPAALRAYAHALLACAPVPVGQRRLHSVLSVGQPRSSLGTRLARRALVASSDRRTRARATRFRNDRKPDHRCEAYPRRRDGRAFGGSLAPGFRYWIRSARITVSMMGRLRHASSLVTARVAPVLRPVAI